MSFRAWVGVVLTCGSISACGKALRSDAAVRAGGPTGTVKAVGAAELEAWARALAEALCSQDRNCPVLTPSFYVSFEACLDNQFGRVSQYYAYYGGVDHFADWASVYEVASPEAQQSCLSALSDCVRLDDAPCAEVLVARAPSPLGGPCGGDQWHTPRVCADGLFCSHSTACPSCQPRVGESQNCDSAACQAGLYCRQNSHFSGDVVVNDPSYCERLLQAGEACDHQGCAAGLECSSSKCTPLIHAAPGGPCQSSQCPIGYNCSDMHCERQPDRAKLGEACGRGTYGCAAPLQCVNDKCEALAPEGAVCRRATSTEGGRCERWCVFDSPDASEGHCSSSPPTSGAVPCSIYGLEQMGCPAGTHADTLGEEPPYPALPAYCSCEPNGSDAGDGGKRDCE